MSRISNAVKNSGADEGLRMTETHENFMGGDSYQVDPITRMKLVTASSIFGEPSYYRDNDAGTNRAKSWYSCMVRNMQEIQKADILHIMDIKGNKTTDQVMVECIKDALDYDFEQTLQWAVELRNKFNIRLNPQIIMVLAATHPARQEFTQKYPWKFANYSSQVMSRADDAISQMEYYLYTNGSKHNMPSVLKRAWARHISSLSDYEVLKYKNTGIGMVNAVRLCHAHSRTIDKLMHDELVPTDETNTWERLRASGMKWEEIFHTIKMGHMAMLRNLVGFLNEVTSVKTMGEYLNALVKGVANGKQFPFRYYGAYLEVKNRVQDDTKRMLGLKVLERCIDEAVKNMPRLKGKTMCLSDNSGSAWGAFTSENGRFTVAEIDNLSSVITAMRSDEGYVGVFGDKLKVYKVDKNRGCLEQAVEMSEARGNDVGLDTEGGIWEFFNRAIDEKQHWDNIFIYSDQQAGTGGLYGTREQMYKYQGSYGLGIYINVFKLVKDYRAYVHNKVNVFSVQTAGYSDMVLPNYAYRVNLLYGWTGKEAQFAKAVIDLWDEADKQNK